jgi:membrane-bound serine protease (ClpP class)
MAPDTAIGAATPVSVGGDDDGLSDDMRNKVINDAVAYARAIATAHDRNPDWAESAVREGASLPAPEALELGVIDLIAADFNDLLAQLDGFQYLNASGNTVVLATAGANVTDFNMTAVESFLYAIADPNIAYLLLTLAMLGIMLEIFNPGMIFPGTVGAIAGILAFLSLGMLPVNYAGIILMVIAFGLFIAEALTPTFGLLTVAGAAALITGSLILFKEGGPLFEVNIWLVVAVTIVLAAVTVLIATTVVRTYRRKVSAGMEDMSGRRAEVRTALTPAGTVFLEGEIWSAEIEDGEAAPGEQVLVTGADGLRLKVRKIK